MVLCISHGMGFAYLETCLAMSTVNLIVYRQETWLYCLGVEERSVISCAQWLCWAGMSALITPFSFWVAKFVLQAQNMSAPSTPEHQAMQRSNSRHSLSSGSMLLDQLIEESSTKFLATADVVEWL